MTQTFSFSLNSCISLKHIILSSRICVYRVGIFLTALSRLFLLTYQTLYESSEKFFFFFSQCAQCYAQLVITCASYPRQTISFFFSISVCCCSQYSPCCPCISLGVLISRTLSCHPLSFCFLPHSSPEVIPVLIFEANIFSAFKRLQCYG